MPIAITAKGSKHAPLLRSEVMNVREQVSGDSPQRVAYEIRIKGRVSDALLLAFEDVSVSVNPAETVIRSWALDQAALYGLLHRIHALGLELVEVRQLPMGDN